MTSRKHFGRCPLIAATQRSHFVLLGSLLRVLRCRHWFPGRFLAKTLPAAPTPLLTNPEALNISLASRRPPRRWLCSYVQDYDPANPATHQGRDLAKMSMSDLYTAFGLVETTIDFVVRTAPSPSILSGTASCFVIKNWQRGSDTSSDD